MIKIYHIEDEEQDRAYVRYIVYSLDVKDVKYIPIKVSLDVAIDTIIDLKQPSILILDLNLYDGYSEYKTVTDLYYLYTKLLGCNFAVIIFSEYLNQSIKFLLYKAGIPKNQIISKYYRREKSYLLKHDYISNGDRDFINILNGIVDDIRSDTLDKYPVIHPEVFEKEIIRLLTILNDNLSSGFMELKKGQAVLYQQLSEKNQRYLLRIIDYLKKQQLDHHQIERMTTLCIHEIEEKNYPSEYNEYMCQVNTSLKSKISLNQKLELIIPIIPSLLQYKITFSEGDQLQQVWDALCKLIK